MKEEDEINANCCRHGGRALIVNCWECSQEFKEDESEQKGEEDD